MENRASIFKFFLFAMNKDRPRVYKERDYSGDKDADGYQEEDINDTNIDKGNRSGHWTLEHVHNCDSKRIIEDPQVA
jgi:hypothetical protein